MSKRHDKIGIKQGLRKEWLDFALNLRLAGVTDKEMRYELTEYMGSRLDNGELGTRGEFTTKIAVCMLMNVWGKCDNELEVLQRNALALAKNDNFLACHWAMLCAAYPFWHKVAQQTGRLLFLQVQTNKAQIIQRIRENYGDRSSVIRSAQRVIQGFMGCGTIITTDNYQLELTNTTLLSTDLTILLYEAALYADKEGKAALGLLKNNPAFFPFQLPVLSGDYIAQQSNTIDVVRYGLDDELLKLKDNLTNGRQI